LVLPRQNGLKIISAKSKTLQNKKLSTSFHGNHPAYSDYVEARISKLQKDGKLNAESIKALLEKKAIIK
jgi:hypothetical protein